MAKRYYLAYGSNLNVAQMRWRCPDARALGTAWIDDYELLFKGSKTGSYLTIEPKEGSRVPVAVWDVSAEDEKRLDCYEGFPTFYYKKELLVTFKGIRSGKERRRSCFIYIMHEERELGVPSRSYVETCLEGYEDFGFDADYLKEAFEKSTEEIQ